MSVCLVVLLRIYCIFLVYYVGFILLHLVDMQAVFFLVYMLCSC